MKANWYYSWNEEIPYASVGISSPDGTKGINYTFNNEYPPSSAPLQNRRAILFAMQAREFEERVILGQVTDLATENPINGAVVKADYGFSVQSDEDGNYCMPHARSDLMFSLTGSKQGYNDSTRFALQFDDSDILRIDFALRHPVFNASDRELVGWLQSGEQEELPLQIENPGNGTLEWTAERRLPDRVEVDPWQLRRVYEFGEISGDIRLDGVIYANGLFYVSGSDSRIYIFNRESQLIDTIFTQLEQSFKDIAWDGELIWGSIMGTVYGLDTEGNVEVSFETDIYNIQLVAWDPDREWLWLGQSDRHIQSYNRQGEHQNISIRNNLYLRGLAYWSNDPDGYQLYGFSRNMDINVQQLSKFNIETEDTMLAAWLDPAIRGHPIGIFITDDYDQYSTVLMCVTQITYNEPDDRVNIIQIETNKDWFGITRYS